MKILVLDLYNVPRDLAQTDMYLVFNEKFDMIFSNKFNFLDLLKKNDFDYLYLGLYHTWCGVKNLASILKNVNKPIIIDQADNEGFIARISKNNFYPKNSILLSKYLPNDRLSQVWGDNLYLLPWYINADRFISNKKEIDVSFICTMEINRLGNDRKKIGENVEKYCKKNHLTYKIGQDFNNYIDLITKSKVMVIDGSRFCLTQKYLESSLSNCIIVGEKPISPPNDLIVRKLEDINLDTIDKFSGDIFYNRRYVLNNFSNKNKLISNFENIIKKINIYK